MIVHGGALKGRADWVDDVISFPFEPLEFAARIRTQFRERQPELELEAKLKDALQKEHLAETAVEAWGGGTTAKRAIGYCCDSHSGSTRNVVSTGTPKDTLQLKGGCAAERRNPATGRTPAPRGTSACVPDASDASGTRESLKVQRRDRKKIAADGDTDSESPRNSFRRRRIAEPA